MSQRIGRPCLVCGRRVTDGTSRCDAHKNQSGALPTSCRVCGMLGPRPYCSEHQPTEYGGRRSESGRNAQQPWRAGYRDPNYPREREAARKRAAGRCERCGRSDLPLECDHIVPLSTARSAEDYPHLNHRDNLRMLCRRCHVGKTFRR